MADSPSPGEMRRDFSLEPSAIAIPAGTDVIDACDPQARLKRIDTIWLCKQTVSGSELIFRAPQPNERPCRIT
jgi:hypothetical protein